MLIESSISMRFLDAFAGIGGFHAGVKQAIPDAPV